MNCPTQQRLKGPHCDGRRRRDVVSQKNPNPHVAIHSREGFHQIYLSWWSERLVQQIRHPGPRDLPQKDELPECHWKVNGADVQGSQSAIGNWDSPLGRFMYGLTHPKTQKKTAL